MSMENGADGWETYRRLVLNKQDELDDEIKGLKGRTYDLELKYAVAQGRAAALGMIAGGLGSAFMVILKIIVDHYYK